MVGPQHDSPEGYFSGLQPGESPGELQFIMPRIKSETPTSTLSFGVDSMAKILVAKRELAERPSVALRFVSSAATKHVVGFAVNVVVTELLDTALADMLDTIGDVSLEAARDKLQDVSEEPTLEGKRRHRLVAEGHLGTVFRASTKAIKERERKWWLSSEPRIQELRTATLAAATIALINKDAGLQPAATTWANRAKEQFDAYISLAGDDDVELLKQATDRVALLKSGAILPIFFPTGMFMPTHGYHISTRKIETENAEYHIKAATERLIPLAEAQQQFMALHANLVAPE